jgi:glutathione synthase/RimK-type ligase-like ATP-grasp enzyme
MESKMKIGMLTGAENTFPPALIEKINGMNEGVEAEYVKIGGIKMGGADGYRLIFDRISHEIPFYRSYLKNAVLNGCIVVNNPFWTSADDKFFAYSLAAKLGLTVPNTILLPQKSYKPGITESSLRNLEFPLNWDGIIEYVGLPAILKPRNGGGWKDVYHINSLEDLWSSYDNTGTLAMVLQQYIEYDQYVRCYCVARKHVLVMPYDPANRRYLSRSEHPLESLIEDRIVRDTLLINEALGYDFNALDFAVKDGVAYAIDLTNPVPDADLWSITEPNFNWLTGMVAGMLVDYAKNAMPTQRYHRWNKWLNQEHPHGMPSTAGELAQDIVAGVGEIAQKASNVLSEVIDSITEPIKPRRPRKTSVEKPGSKSAKSAKDTGGSKSSKSAKKDR